MDQHGAGEPGQHRQIIDLSGQGRERQRAGHQRIPAGTREQQPGPADFHQERAGKFKLQIDDETDGARDHNQMPEAPDLHRRQDRKHECRSENRACEHSRLRRAERRCAPAHARIRLQHQRNGDGMALQPLQHQADRQADAIGGEFLGRKNAADHQCQHEIGDRHDDLIADGRAPDRDGAPSRPERNRIVIRLCCHQCHERRSPYVRQMPRVS